jgi:hypothetical protein
MTRETITLPIKCSTLKTADTYLKNIIGIEILVFFITFVLSASHFKISDLFTDYAIQIYIISATVTIGWCALIFCLWVMVVIWEYISDRMPNLECIKDVVTE